MHKVVIENMMPMAGVDIKNQLVNLGLEINRDFVSSGERKPKHFIHFEYVGKRSKIR